MKTPANIQTALDFEGMTSDRGLVIMNLFIKKAIGHHPDGLCFEFGTYKGRTAALIASQLGEESWLHAVEQSDYLEIDKIYKISPRVTWHKEKSEDFCINNLDHVVGNSKVAYSHHDASHFFDNVHTELENLVNKMAKFGVIVLDDFNDTFSQVRAAYYYLRYTSDFPYELLLIGFNKAVLVHQDQFDYYENYVLNDLLDELEKYDFYCKLCRSDINQHSRSFSLSYRASPDADQLYGTKFWGKKFYQPSKTFLE